MVALLALIEAFEDMLFCFRTYALAAVGDADCQISVFQSGFHTDAASVRGIFKRVRQQVVKDFVYFRGVKVHHIA